MNPLLDLILMCRDLVVKLQGEDGFDLVAFNRDRKNGPLKKKKTLKQLEEEEKVRAIEERLLK